MCGEGHYRTVYTRVDDLCLDIAYGVAKYNSIDSEEFDKHPSGTIDPFVIEFPTNVIVKVKKYLLTYSKELTSNSDGSFNLLNGITIKENSELTGKQFKLINT